MSKFKSIVFMVSLMLLILSVTMGYFSFKDLSAIVPADSYEDKGVYTFAPYRVLPVQVKNTSSSGRNQRMNPTKTIYKVYYRATDGSGYQWTKRAINRKSGQKIVDAKTTVKRRVLSITTKRTYITVEPDQTAESYTAGLQQRYIIILILAGAYILLYVVVGCILIFMKKAKKNSYV